MADTPVEGGTKRAADEPKDTPIEGGTEHAADDPKDTPVEGGTKRAAGDPKDRVLPKQASQPASKPCKQTCERLQLTPIDHTIARIYVRVHLCFPFEGDVKAREMACRRIFYSLGLAFQRWPYLAGKVGPPNVQEVDALDVEYMLPLSPANVSDCVQRFAANKKGVNGTHLTYAQLTKWGAPADWFRELSFSPTAFDYGEELSSKPGSNGGTEPGRDRVMGLRATFFEGGLVLGFAFHHAVMDGPSIKRFL